MGSGTSRGKRVAPARGSDADARPASGVAASGPDEPKVRAAARNERSRALPPECHSDGHDSDASAEDDAGDGDADAGVEERRRTRPPRKAKARTYGLCHFSREDAEDDFGAEGPRGARGGSTDVNNGSSDALTRFKKHATRCPGPNNSSTQGFVLRGALLEAVPTSEKQSGDQNTRPLFPVRLRLVRGARAQQKTASVAALLERDNPHGSLSLRSDGSRHGSSLTMPVILYDGSEEELMDTIEREFS
ncbi:uncharacterized protein LOC114848230 isoform X2 [Betta splendens]|uniref:Uncharacterized protein LOC114848230 isoform X2 n=1 Tax=Betta splendens TaxID=158456 RepID=A0A9W2XJD8_BETSP|nr:uncharacterized protein LOC114848230 isoform X2 [Betta splendens]